jgi:pimeloyl-ACP methyl ester carboxylesterase
MAVFRHGSPGISTLTARSLRITCPSQGEQPVVWLHGLPLNSRSWSAQRALLAQFLSTAPQAN